MRPPRPWVHPTPAGAENAPRTAVLRLRSHLTKDIAMTNRPIGFYAQYLERLCRTAETAGLPAVPEPWSDPGTAALNEIEAQRGETPTDRAWNLGAVAHAGRR
jgi:hypothetical protein